MLAETLGCIKFGHPDILQKWSFGFMPRNAHQVNGRKSLKIEIGGKWSPCCVTWYQLPDQFYIRVTGLKDALNLINDPIVVQSIKTFNLRQMQKGATIYGKYQCIDLAIDILTSRQSSNLDWFVLYFLPLLTYLIIWISQITNQREIEK